MQDGNNTPLSGPASAKVSRGNGEQEMVSMRIRFYNKLEHSNHGFSVTFSPEWTVQRLYEVVSKEYCEAFQVDAPPTNMMLHIKGEDLDPKKYGDETIAKVVKELGVKKLQNEPYFYLSFPQSQTQGQSNLVATSEVSDTEKLKSTTALTLNNKEQPSLQQAILNIVFALKGVTEGYKDMPVVVLNSLQFVTKILSDTAEFVGKMISQR